ncbi:MAG: haloacid dehalogenase type II [Verrucomicrobia bacterium]|nr:haloacid dehalogenase type II [Verrucomicrobiota bacterium]
MTPAVLSSSMGGATLIGAQACSAPKNERPGSLKDVKALTFDVFGTVVDWRSSIIAEGEALGKKKGLDVDWTAVADGWRAGYGPYMNKVRNGELPWTNIDRLHRMILDELVEQFELQSLSEDELDDFNRGWHRLEPWPDTIEGLSRLRKSYTIASLSNGNVSLLSNMANRAGIPWDAVLSSELAKRYKPDPIVYQTAAQLLGLKHEEVMMVAAHAGDLRAAQGVGFKTAFVHRPFEFGEERRVEASKLTNFDIVAEDFNDLADQLGA